MNSERGSVVIMIFIGMLLFAALGFAMMQGSRTSTSMMDSEQARTYARQIVSTGTELKQGIKRLSLRGIQDGNISFESSTTGATYTNGGCGTPSCKLFEPSGGGLTPPTSPAQANDGSAWLFTTGEVPGIGNSGTPELIALLPNVDAAVCGAINTMTEFGAGNGAIPQESDVINLTPFTGTYSPTIMDDGTYFSGKSQGCFQGGGTPPTTAYYYYAVVLAR